MQKQKNRTLARQVIHGSRSLYGDYHELLAPSSLKHVNASATIYWKIKTNYSKTSSNLDLPRSMVFVVLFPSINFCVGDAKHMANNQKQAWSWVNIPRTRWAPFCISSQSPLCFYISKPCPPFNTADCEETSMVTLMFFFSVFAKNSLMKNIFKENKVS